ncbi:MAG TPA: ABC transporter permease, partial [Vicinamibacterales bacterium]|nr:ABC transporter permease [Vicinamibacterales bacterium]
EETSYGATDSVAILSEPYWRQQFGSDPAVVGKSIRVNSTAFTIVGVLPHEFSFLSSRARIFLPLASGADDRLSARRHWGSSSHMLARRASGATISDAQAQVDANNAAMEHADPEARLIADAGFRSVVAPLQGRHVASVRPMLLLLQAGAAVLLLIGLVNVANLFLVRAGSRSRELGVRRAIGARTAHIVAAVTVEAVLLSTAGAAAGVPVAQMGVALVGSLGASRLPLGSHIALHAEAAGFAVLTALACGIVLGVVTSWHAIRDDAGGALRVESRGATASRRTQRTRHAILVAQIALSFVLLSGAVALVSTLRSLMQTSPGFAAERLLTGQVSLPWTRYRTDASLRSFIDRLTAELRRTPGVIASGLSTNVPLSGNAMKSAALVLGRPPAPGESPHGVYSYAIAGDYFAAMGIPLREGRYLTAGDVRSPARVCAVDEDFARRYWPNGGGVGHQLLLGSAQGPAIDAFTIVGVVGAVKQAALSETERVGAVYYPYSDRFDRALYIVTRASVAPDSLQPEIRRIVRRIDPELPVNNLRTMDMRVADSLAEQRSPALFGTVFSAMALLLTALGTYGVLTYAVSQRRREIGLRLALGARPADVRTQFLAVGVRLLTAGMAIGVAGSWVALNVLGGAIAGVRQPPAASLAVASIVLVLTCLVACLLPALQAARVAPITVLAPD